jgi:SAM-dependent methyltransferase
VVEIVLVERPRGVPSEAARTIWLEDLGLAHEDRHSYAPVPWGLLRRLLPRSAITSDDVFLDLGCGMGRLLLEAAECYPFKRVVGVELVPRFAEAAESLLRRNAGRLRASGWEVVTADVADYRVPDDVTVAYLYDPVVGEAFDSVLEQLRRSVERRPRRVRILYITPEEVERLARVPGAMVTRRGTTAVFTMGARYRYVEAELRGEP